MARPWVGRALPFLRSGPLWRVNVAAEPDLRDALKRLDLRVIDLDGSAMTSRVAAHGELKRAFGFPEWCGPNWDAFNDCFGGFVHEHDGERIAVVWNDFDASTAAAPASTAEVVWALLECAEGLVPTLNPAVTWSIDLDLFVLGSGDDFDGP